MDGYLQLLLVSAATAGLLGGAHCAVMCGGIVGAMCGGGARPVSWQRALAYNAGRIASYATAGAIVGAIGQAGIALHGEPTLRHLLMIGASLTLVVLALFLAGWSPLVRGMEAAGAVLWRRLQPLTRHVLPANTVPRALALGALWGWLPCGMVYAVLLTAAATGSARDGALVMTAFGFGTLPNLLAMAAFARQMQQYARVRWVRYAGAALVAGFGLYGIAHAAQPQALRALAACFSTSAPEPHAR